MKQIMLNLINNALKYTFSGKVEIVIVPSEPDSEEDQLNQFYQISVKDTGIGIPKKDLLELQKTLEKRDSQSMIIKTGSGLGLNIANHLSSLLCHGELGGIHIDSEKDIGSNFYFLIEDM